MPETPKLFRKKSKVKIWFNGLAREVLMRGFACEWIKCGYRKYSGYLSRICEFTQWRFWIGSRDEGTISFSNDIAEIRQQYQLLQAQLTETKKKRADIEQKDKDKSFAQTWQESATPETQDPIERVVARLERPKVKDAQEVYMSFLKAEKAAGRGDRLTIQDLSKGEAKYKLLGRIT